MDINLSLIAMQIETIVADFLTNLPNVILGLVILVLFVIGARAADRGVKSVANRYGRSKNAATILGLLARWTVLIIGTLIALSIILPTFAAGDLIQMLGIGSVAIGFAFRSIFENFLAGIILLLTDAFQIGDQIIVEGLEGTVTDIQTRATVIQTYDGRIIIIPNATLFTNPVTVNTAFVRRRSEIEVGIGYHEDIDTAVAIIMDILKSTEYVLDDPAPDVLVSQLADSSVNLRPRWWTGAQRRDVVSTKSEVTRRIKYALDERGIEIPFPIRTVYMHQSNGNGREEAAGAG